MTSLSQTLRRRGMLPLVAFLVALTSHGLASAQEEPRAQETTGDAQAEVKLTDEQARLAERYDRLELLAGRLAELTRSTQPSRAKLLREFIAKSRERDLHGRFESVVELLEKNSYSTALDGQKQLHGELKQLLELLLKEDRDRQLESERKRIAKYLQELKKLIRRQRGITARTEGGDDADQLGRDQERAEEETRKLRDAIEQTEGDGKSKSGEQAGEAGQSGQESGEPSDGKSKAGEQAEKSPDGEGNDGEAKKDKKDKNKPDLADPEPGEDGEQGESSDGSEQSETPNEGNPGDGKPSEGKPQSGKSQQGGQPSDGGESQQSEQDQPQQEPNSPTQRALQKLQQAQQRMQQAQKKLDEAQRDGAVEDQEQAVRDLETAKAELERILRQLREEEMERMLVLLEVRFRKMLDAQIVVYDGTIRLDKGKDSAPQHEREIAAARLSRQERQIVRDADRALVLLREDGTSVAFPEAVQQAREDMHSIAIRLDDLKVGILTQGLEEDVIAALEETLAALQQAIQELREQKNNQQQQQQQQGGEPGEQPLVDRLAELRMIKSLQARVNKRTARYGAMIDGEQALEEELLSAIHELAERQERIFEATEDLHTGRNQ